ncbi:hypothetical protein G3A49_13615 [Haloferax volcanii]|uniref:DUF8013 domain-containing protein n=1 Tax=Haloferax volcanii TaxID=2246 RepID=A0A6C0UVA1_HALVO|nr:MULTISPECIES: hypothetical protein [Haloferax]ELK55705.1 hypothetical protein D320_03136 [Haloferax sp. BAB-2207]QIB79107.1 hypothetical protein G3A49_13615 [Haloferax alexandrinus]
MSHQQTEPDVSIDEIPVDLELVHRSEFTRADIPDEIESITWSLLSERPPTNPLVVLKAARWWYIHGAGESDPVYCWAIEWARHLTTGEATASGLFGECRQYLHSLERDDNDR